MNSEPLRQAGIDCAGDAGSIAVRIPGRPFGVRDRDRWKLAVPGALLAIALYVTAAILRLDMEHRLIMTATIAVLGLSMTLLFARLNFGFGAYTVVVDGVTRTVDVPAHAEWDACRFGFDEVRTMNVDWSRAYETPPRPGAPITLLSVELWRKMDGMDDTQAHVLLDLSGFAGGQAKVFVTWLHDAVAAKRPLGELEPEAAIAAGRVWTR